LRLVGWGALSAQDSALRAAVGRGTAVFLRQRFCACASAGEHYDAAASTRSVAGKENAMSVRYESRNGIGLVRITTSLSATIAESLPQQVDAWLQTMPEVKSLVFDLGEVNFMDSSGLGAMISVFKRMAERGGKTVVARPQSAVKLMLQITRADQILHIYDTVDDAIRSTES
jgi:anti-anti-sigma factor